MLTSTLTIVTTSVLELFRPWVCHHNLSKFMRMLVFLLCLEGHGFFGVLHIPWNLIIIPLLLILTLGPEDRELVIAFHFQAYVPRSLSFYNVWQWASLFVLIPL